MACVDRRSAAAALPASRPSLCSAGWCVLNAEPPRRGDAVSSLRVRVPPRQAPKRRVAGSSPGERSPVPSGASRARVEAYAWDGGSKVAGPIRKGEPCSLVRVETRKVGRPSRSFRGEGNRLRPSTEGRRTSPGYGGGHATTVRHGTGEALPGGLRQANASCISRVRKWLVPEGSPKGS